MKRTDYLEMIEIKNLTKKYNDKLAVDNLNLSIKQGKLLALLGVMEPVKLLHSKCYRV